MSHPFNKNCEICHGPIRSWEQGVDFSIDTAYFCHADCLDYGVDTDNNENKTHMNEEDYRPKNRTLHKNVYCHFCGYCVSSSELSRAFIRNPGRTTSRMVYCHKGCGPERKTPYR